MRYLPLAGLPAFTSAFLDAYADIVPTIDSHEGGSQCSPADCPSPHEWLPKKLEIQGPQKRTSWNATRAAHRALQENGEVSLFFGDENDYI